MSYKISMLLLLSFGSLRAESFFVEPEAVVEKKDLEVSKKKKKRSLNQLREELVSQFETMAHKMMQEIELVSSLAEDWVTHAAGTEDENMNQLLNQRLAAMARLAIFMSTGKQAMVKITGPHKMREVNALRLINQIASAQESLMSAIAALVDGESKNSFVQADKQKLTQCITEVETFIKDSSMFINELKAVRSSQ
jgi:Glu-tRNA(Gln) amidotransferase subunit E-like FAD-binding protein